VEEPVPEYLTLPDFPYLTGIPSITFLLESDIMAMFRMEFLSEPGAPGDKLHG
jgi:hypothetical protein